MDKTLKLYGVSSGDGNNGVSHTFPDFYVWTNDPFKIARDYIYSMFKPEAHQQIEEELEVDGEEDYNVCACLMRFPGDDYEDDYDEGPAVLIVDVYPVDEDDIQEGKNVETVCFEGE